MPSTSTRIDAVSKVGDVLKELVDFFFVTLHSGRTDVETTQLGRMMATMHALHNAYYRCGSNNDGSKTEHEKDAVVRSFGSYGNELLLSQAYKNVLSAFDLGVTPLEDEDFKPIPDTLSEGDRELEDLKETLAPLERSYHIHQADRAVLMENENRETRLTFSEFPQFRPDGESADHESLDSFGVDKGAIAQKGDYKGAVEQKDAQPIICG